MNSAKYLIWKLIIDHHELTRGLARIPDHVRELEEISSKHHIMSESPHYVMHTVKKRTYDAGRVAK
jgi:hypothetical protein